MLSVIQGMIDSNAGMVFYYAYSNPELKRIVHPIAIDCNNVLCIDSYTGLYRRFKINGIIFPQTVEDIIMRHISEGTVFTFRYSDTHPRGNIGDIYAVEPSIIKEDLLITKDMHKGANSFFIKHIHPLKECDGCVNNLANQQGHLEGCLKEPTIISKRHTDCGFLWNYEKDQCGKKGVTRCLFDDDHVEVLNNM